MLPISRFLLSNASFLKVVEFSTEQKSKNLYKSIYFKHPKLTVSIFPSIVGIVSNFYQIGLLQIRVLLNNGNVELLSLLKITGTKDDCLFLIFKLHAWWAAPLLLHAKWWQWLLFRMSQCLNFFHKFNIFLLYVVPCTEFNIDDNHMEILQGDMIIENS